MTLPPSLAPWAALLELFPEEVSPAFGPLLAALARLVGELAAPPASGQDEPVGYTGITRRGIPERLLLSEWLLAEEIPEEFMRRASVREQGYLDLERHSPALRRECRVLFDTGAEQAGAPRVAHLALLLVLGQRAHRAGAVLRWGVVQAPATSGIGTDRASILPLLQQRSPGLPTASELEVWRKHWPSAHPEPECWLVGGPSLRALPHRGPRVILEDALHPKDLTLHLEYRPEQGPLTSLSLPMPSLEGCQRLLRWDQPAARRRPAKAEDLPAAGIQWASHTLRLLVRSERGIRIHSFARDAESLRLIKSIRWNPAAEEAILAMDQHWGRTLVGTQDPAGKLWLYGYGRPPGQVRGPERWPLVPMDRISEGGAAVRSIRKPDSYRELPLVGVTGGFYFIDGDGILVQLEPGKTYWIAALIAEKSSQVAQVNDAAVAVRRSGEVVEAFHPGAPPRELGRWEGAMIGHTRVKEEILLMDGSGRFETLRLPTGSDWKRTVLPGDRLPLQLTTSLAIYQGYRQGGSPDLIASRGSLLLRLSQGGASARLLDEKPHQVAAASTGGALAWIHEKGGIGAGLLRWNGGGMGPACAVEPA